MSKISEITVAKSFEALFTMYLDGKPGGGEE